MLKVEDFSYFDDVLDIIENKFDVFEQYMKEYIVDINKDHIVSLDLYYDIENKEITKSNLIGVSYGPIRIKASMIGPDFKKLLLEEFYETISHKNKVFMEFTPSLNNIMKTNDLYQNNFLNIYDIDDDTIKFLLFAKNPSFGKNKNKAKFPNILKMVNELCIDISKVESFDIKKFRKVFGTETLENVLKNSVIKYKDSVTVSDLMKLRELNNQKTLDLITTEFLNAHKANGESIIDLGKIDYKDPFFNTVKISDYSICRIFEIDKLKNSYRYDNNLMCQSDISELLFPINNSLVSLSHKIFFDHIRSVSNGNFKFLMSCQFRNDINKLLSIKSVPDKNKDLIKLILENAVTNLSDDDLEEISKYRGNYILTNKV